jgi:hypothetical protein
MQFFIVNQMIATLNHLASRPGVGDEYHAALVECIALLKKLQHFH